MPPVPHKAGPTSELLFSLRFLLPHTPLPAQPPVTRFFSFIPVLAALFAAVAGVSVPDDCANTENRCEPHFASKRGFVEHPARNVRAATNAELLRRGLPINYPVLRRGTFAWL